MKLLNILLLSLISLSLSAQTLDEELGFIYVKADYLFETNRFDEAIQEFTKIIAKDPNFKDALYKRAESKFHVGAFKGTKNDLLDVFDIKGITPDALLLFGKTQKNLGDTEASKQTLATAEMLSSGASSSSSGNNRNSDSRDSDDRSADDDSGSSPTDKIVKQIEDVLGDLLPNRKQDSTGSDDRNQDAEPNTRPEPADRTSTTRNGSDDNSNGDTKSDNDRKNRDTDTYEPTPEPEPEVPAVDDSERDLYIDEDVTLTFKNGIGARKVLETPNILILSETSGTVVIDLCINENGKVSSAEYNSTDSTLKTQSIISLAVRKSKEFWFGSDSDPNMCGTIVFNITGS